VLDVSNNQIASLSGIGHLEELEELWASYNQVADFAEVERELGGKKKLSTVYFEGCPLQLRAPALYRNKVRLTLPQVMQIDASKSTPYFYLGAYRTELTGGSFREGIIGVEIEGGLQNHDHRSEGGWI